MKTKLMTLLLLVMMVGTGCNQNSETTAQEEVDEMEDSFEEEELEEQTSDNEEDAENDEIVTGSTVEVDGTTSASIVPDELRNTYDASGFTDSDKKKALIVVGDPRKYSVQYDLTYTTAKHLEENDVEVEVRDLYDLEFNPVLSEDTFYYAKDGAGEAPEYIKTEQDLVSQADFIIFSYPNWHDTPNAIVKGYMEKVFSSGFAYTNNGPEGLLGEDKGMFTIMNCGFLGGGRGFIDDGVGIDDELWNEYMEAFNVLDEDTAGWWGITNLGRFVNDRTPSNNDEDYEEKITELRDSLTKVLDETFIH